MEFPKMIYLGGKHGAEHRIVADQDSQNAAKADGFLPFIHTAKSQEQPAPHDDQQASPEAAGKDELLERAKALGIPAKKTWGEAKLREEIAKAEGSQQ